MQNIPCDVGIKLVIRQAPLMQWLSIHQPKQSSTEIVQKAAIPHQRFPAQCRSPREAKQHKQFPLWNVV
jgi:hypothetical protein